MFGRCALLLRVRQAFPRPKHLVLKMLARGPLFRAANRQDEKTRAGAVSRTDVWYMVRRRALQKHGARVRHCHEQASSSRR